MKQANTGRKQLSVLMVAESVLHLSVIPLSLALFVRFILMMSQEMDITFEPETAKEMEAIFNPADGNWLAAMLFLVLAVIRFFLAFRYREKGKGFFAVSLIQAAGLLVGAALPLIDSFTVDTLMIINIIYTGVMILGRIEAIVRDHRARSVVLNVLCIVVLLVGLFFLAGPEMLMFILAVLALMKIIFAPISLTVLNRIIRKTYAAEIIFGLFLLIITFSFLLYYFEPGMYSFKDALWYCFAIVTTIGFGDLTAVTDFGRILSVILGAYGIVVVALITSIIVNFYGEMKKDGNEPEEEESYGA